ncbi:uncharacterized protein LOC134749640 [Cydia strobilella]|uniref:uncharacterized protein LOC134749640 n=1 Tax=Cydia strobilella TaxID=1100964 RepID=UPI003006BF08
MSKAKTARSKSTQSISFYYQNVRGLRSKTDVFHTNMLLSSYSVVALTETFLVSSVKDAELFSKDYIVLRKDRLGDVGWGGVLLAVHKSLSVRRLSNIDGLSNDMELVSALVVDLVLSGFTPETERVSVCGEVDAFVPADTYHPPLEVLVKFKRVGMRSPTLQPRPPVSGPKWNFRKADLRVLYSAISDIDWGDVLTENCSGTAAELFYAKLKNCIDSNVPLKKPASGNRYCYPTWFTADIIKNIKFKHFHLKRYREKGELFNLEMFRYYRTHVKTLIESAFRHYIRSIERDITDDPSKFWKFVDSKRKDRRCDTEFVYKGKTVMGQEATDSFAEYFASVFQGDVPLLNAKLAAQSCSGLPVSSARVAVEKIDAADLHKAAKDLKARASAGPDDISSFLVKDCISVLEAALLHIFNLSLKNGEYPACWKVSRVTPVPKSGTGRDVSNFRPIAVLPGFAKLFESIIESRISLQIQCWLGDSQHGFRRARSTVTNHVNFVDHVRDELDAGRQVDAAYFDFKKAFDLVDNDILLQKCSALGFTPHLLNFLSSYLRDRNQYVEWGGYSSRPFFTRSGVSQGSTLGSTLFTIMINDLPRVVHTAGCLLFADDLKLYLGAGDKSDLEDLQRDIDAVTEWSENNKLHFNTSKCKVITFSRIRSPHIKQYHIKDAVMDRVDEITDLGLTLDSRLDFRTHVTNICKQANKVLGFVMRNRSIGAAPSPLPSGRGGWGGGFAAAPPPASVRVPGLGEAHALGCKRSLCKSYRSVK